MSAIEETEAGSGAAGGLRPFRYSICVTKRCNLDCSYCYIEKKAEVLDAERAGRIVDFIFGHARAPHPIEICFFGGEPLLELGLIREITAKVLQHRACAGRRVSFAITSNGLVFDDDVAAYLREHRVKYCISLDGGPEVHDLLRRTRNGAGSCARVSANLRRALASLPLVLTNSVVHPATFRRLPESVEYLSALGARHLYLNPDFSATWTEADCGELGAVLEEIAGFYRAKIEEGDPHFVSVIDAKIGTLLRGGYSPEERCQMGGYEMAFAPDGRIYPCERLLGYHDEAFYCIGDLEEGLVLSRMRRHLAPEQAERQNPCTTCDLRQFCVNWCGCSNVFQTGCFNRTGPFLCAFERASVRVAAEVLEAMNRKYGFRYLRHLEKLPLLDPEVLAEPPLV